MASWRDHARPIIARVLSETAGQDEKAIRKALRDAYPYGQRQYHPYKIWCDEIRVQRGLKPSKKKLTPRDEEQARLYADAMADKESL